MYYSEVFFKKDIYDVTEQDVVDFFADSPEESSILELKSGDNLKIEKIFPEVCALHNTQGGLVIIGSPIPRKHEGREYFDGETTRSPFKDKDWLYQKISSNISPVPSGLRIHDVKMTDGKFIQIIDIPKSLHPPHQCLNNGIYYLRFETQSRFAPHGLVEAMFNRRIEPLINCEIADIDKYLNNSKNVYAVNITNDSNIPLIGFHLSLTIRNCGVAKYIDEYDNFIEMTAEIKLSESLLSFNKIINNNDVVVVAGVSRLVKFKIYANNDKETCLIELFTWGENMNLVKHFFIMSPKDNSIYKLDTNTEENHQLIHSINRLTAKLKSSNIIFDEKGLLSLSAKLFKSTRRLYTYLYQKLVSNFCFDFLNSQGGYGTYIIT